MRRRIPIIVVILVILLGLVGLALYRLDIRTPKLAQPIESQIILPEPRFESKTSVEEAIHNRRSVRQFTDEPLTLAEASQLLWAAQGITGPSGQRTAPSAGALYPLEIYLLVGNVDGLSQGIYKYIPKGHELAVITAGDYRQTLFNAALSQEAVRDAAVVIVIAAVYERTTVKYGDRGLQYVHIEVGNVAQNVYMQAVALNLGTVFIGAFHDDQVKNVINLPENIQPLGLMPVGRK